MQHTPESLEARFKMLARLQEGWLEGEGKAIDPAAILLASQISMYLGEQHRPYVYPELEGGVRFEWTAKTWGWEATINADQTMHVFGVHMTSEEIVDILFPQDTPQKLSDILIGYLTGRTLDKS